MTQLATIPNGHSPLKMPAQNQESAMSAVLRQPSVLRADELADVNYPAVFTHGHSQGVPPNLLAGPGLPVSSQDVTSNSRSQPHSHLLMPQHSAQRLARNSLAVSGTPSIHKFPP